MPARAPKPVSARRAAPPAATRSASGSPDPVSGIRRISTRPGLSFENGMRQSVFSFLFRQTAFRFDASHNLHRQFHRPGFDQRLRRCRSPIDLKPLHSDQSPFEIRPLDLRRHHHALDLFSNLAPRVEILRLPPDLANPPRQLHPSAERYPRNLKSNPRRRCGFAPDRTRVLVSRTRHKVRLPACPAPCCSEISIGGASRCRRIAEPPAPSPACTPRTTGSSAAPTATSPRSATAAAPPDTAPPSARPPSRKFRS